jgi:hypothetical protein
MSRETYVEYSEKERQWYDDLRDAQDTGLPMHLLYVPVPDDVARSPFLVHGHPGELYPRASALSSPA